MLPLFFSNRQSGFSLVEMAIVLIIVALLLGGLLPTISSQVGQQRVSETSKQLEEIKEALLGFSVINGRLPCPATKESNGMESFCAVNASGVACGAQLSTPVPANGRCFSPYTGFVPAATLGITPVDSNGYVLDGWNNRIHYAATAWTSAAGIDVFTAPRGMSTVGISSLSPGGTPHLQVCNAASADGDKCSVANSSLASNPGVLAVIYSTGKNGAYGGTGTDETENPNPNSLLDNNRVFVSHTPTPGTAPNGEFDDIVIWLSTNVLINRMVTSGRLP